MSLRITVVEQRNKDDLAHVQQLQAAARKENDVVKLTCVNDAMVQLNGQLNLFDAERVQFQASLNGPFQGAAHEYDVLVSMSDKIEAIRGNADACIGVPELYKQESGTEVHHPVFPDDPTSPPEGDHGEDYEPPGYASPFI